MPRLPEPYKYSQTSDHYSSIFLGDGMKNSIDTGWHVISIATFLQHLHLHIASSSHTHFDTSQISTWVSIETYQEMSSEITLAIAQY